MNLKLRFYSTLENNCVYPTKALGENFQKKNERKCISKWQLSFEMPDLPINEHSQNYQHHPGAATRETGNHLI